MVRTKLIAILLGPAGVGLVGLYQSAAGLVGTVAGLGIGQSGVREVAKSEGDASSETTARVAYTIRSVSLVLWLVGALVATTLVRPLSLLVFT